MRGGARNPLLRTGPDVPAEDREKVYGDSFNSKHPALAAAFLCDGIQWCLTEIDAHGPLCVTLSRRVAKVKQTLGKLFQE